MPCFRAGQFRRSFLQPRTEGQRGLPRHLLNNDWLDPKAPNQIVWMTPTAAFVLCSCCSRIYGISLYPRGQIGGGRTRAVPNSVLQER